MLSMLIRDNMHLKRLHHGLWSLESCMIDGKHEAFMDSHKHILLLYVLKQGTFWLRCFCRWRSQKHLITVIFYTFVVAAIPSLVHPLKSCWTLSGFILAQRCHGTPSLRWCKSAEIQNNATYDWPVSPSCMCFNCAFSGLILRSGSSMTGKTNMGCKLNCGRKWQSFGVGRWKNNPIASVYRPSRYKESFL